MAVEGQNAEASRPAAPVFCYLQAGQHVFAASSKLACILYGKLECNKLRGNGCTKSRDVQVLTCLLPQLSACTNPGIAWCKGSYSRSNSATSRASSTGLNTACAPIVTKN
eukprot:1138553-Pelagomonas_calceolata.AAC.5